MPDPRELRVDDRIRFVALPVEWSDPEYTVDDESVTLMKTLIARGRSSRVSRIASDGYPWIEVRLRLRDGSVEYRDWGIHEATGWLRVAGRA